MTITKKVLMMHSLDITLVIGYLALTFIIGLYCGRDVKNIKDFALSDGSFSTPVLVATIFATVSGGYTFFGTTERLCTVGLLFLLLKVGSPIYKIATANLLVPRIAKFSHCLSAGDLLKQKFGTFGQVIGGAATFTKSLGIVAAQITAVAFFISSLANISFLISVIGSSFIVIIYASYGGIRSVVMTDVIQFAILLIGVPLLAVFGVYQVGGLETTFDALMHKTSWPAKDWLWYCSLFLIVIMPDFSPAVLQRMLMTKNVKSLKKSFYLSASLDLPMLAMVSTIAGIALALNSEVSPNAVFPYLINTLLPVGLKGIVIAGVMAAIMSTADSYLNTASVALIHDVVKPLSKNGVSRQNELFWTRIASLIIGTFAIGAALYFKKIFQLYIAFLNVWAPVVVVPLYAVVFNYDCDIKDFIKGSIAGLFAWFFWKNIGQDFWGIHPLLVSLVSNAIVFYRRALISRFKKLLPV